MNATALMFGFFAILIGVYPLLTRKNLRDNGECVDSVVVSSERRKSGFGKRVFVLLKYEANGATYETEYTTATSAFKYKDGEIVRIIYRKDDPRQIVIENDKSTVLTSVTFLLVGVVVILSAFGIL